MRYAKMVHLTIWMLSLALLGGLTAPPAEAALRVGMQLPAGQFADLAGAPLRVPDTTRGKVAVLHFWTSGCSSCKEEMPALDSLYRTMRGKGLEVVAVNVGQSKREVEKTVAGLGLTMPVLLDSARTSTGLYDVVGVSRTIIVDRNGTIRYKIIGGTTPELLKKYILSLMGG